MADQYGSSVRKFKIKLSKNGRNEKIPMVESVE